MALPPRTGSGNKAIFVLNRTYRRLTARTPLLAAVTVSPAGWHAGGTSAVDDLSRAPTLPLHLIILSLDDTKLAALLDRNQSLDSLYAFIAMNYE